MTALLSSLALFLQNDPFNTTTTPSSTSNTEAANAIAGLGVGLVAFFVILFLAVFAGIIWLLWRIFVKAGMSGALSLLVLVPFGPIICLCILAFGAWKVVPVQTANTYGGPPLPYPPNPYPSQGQLPPQNYPAAQSYPTQNYGQGSGSNYGGYPPSSGQV